jgi:hypothetical protein
MRPRHPAGVGSGAFALDAHRSGRYIASCLPKRYRYHFIFPFHPTQTTAFSTQSHSISSTHSNPLHNGPRQELPLFQPQGVIIPPDISVDKPRFR